MKGPIMTLARNWASMAEVFQCSDRWYSGTQLWCRAPLPPLHHLSCLTTRCISFRITWDPIVKAPQQLDCMAGSSCCGNQPAKDCSLSLNKEVGLSWDTWEWTNPAGRGAASAQCNGNFRQGYIVLMDVCVCVCIYGCVLDREALYTGYGKSTRSRYRYLWARAIWVHQRFWDDVNTKGHKVHDIQVFCYSLKKHLYFSHSTL